MHHHDHHGCCCGHDHDHMQDQRQSCPVSEGELSGEERALLHELDHHDYLPVARFLLESTKQDDFSSVALAPVYLRHPEESLEQVRRTGALLLGLEEKGYLSLDYGYPLDGYPYEEYHGSQVYAYFCRSVEEARGREGFLGDTPVLELGSIAPMEK